MYVTPCSRESNNRALGRGMDAFGIYVSAASGFDWARTDAEVAWHSHSRHSALSKGKGMLGKASVPRLDEPVAKDVSDIEAGGRSHQEAHDSHLHVKRVCGFITSID